MKEDVKYAPGMRIIVRGEEWIVKRVETNSLHYMLRKNVRFDCLIKNGEKKL